MPGIIRALSSILVLTVISTACTKKEYSQSQKFGAASIRGEWYEFTALHFGEISIPEENMTKLAASDSNGNPLYPTAEIVQWVGDSDQIILQPEHGFALSFIVPEIQENDYVIITAEIKPPAPITLGKNSTPVIQGSFRYDTRNSNTTEYIWYLPEGEILSKRYKGEWKITISADNVTILNHSFFMK